MSKMKILVAGHGGQGILLLGDYIAYSGMLQGKRVAFTPSYGPETRGGKAKCYVILSDEEIDNPIAEEPDIEIIMNRPSMEFLNYLRPGGLLIYNQSLIEDEVNRGDVKKLAIPATEIADELKREFPSDVRDTKMYANTVMLGAFLELCAPQITDGTLNETFQHFLGGKKEALIPLNQFALNKGRRFARANPIPEIKPESPFHCIPSWAAQ